jgi:hypothetical protein
MGCMTELLQVAAYWYHSFVAALAPHFLQTQPFFADFWYNSLMQLTEGMSYPTPVILYHLYTTATDFAPTYYKQHCTYSLRVAI